MAYVYYTGCSLGAGATGLAIGYRVIRYDDESVLTAFTTTNVLETGVAGDYVVQGGLSLPDYVPVRIEWGTAGTKYVNELVDPAPLFYGRALAELLQAQPPATPNFSQALMLIYMGIRNQRVSDSGEERIANDAGTVIAKSPLADTGSVFTKSKMVAGP